MSVFMYRMDIFQSTLPRGSDNKSHFKVMLSFYFNPRSLAGATGFLLHRPSTIAEFQSTLPRGSDVNSERRN